MSSKLKWRKESFAAERGREKPEKEESVEEMEGRVRVRKAKCVRCGGNVLRFEGVVWCSKCGER